MQTEALFGEVYAATALPQRAAATNGHTAAAVVPAFDAAKLREEISPSLPDVELPVLGPEPTVSELLAYASAHPAVRAAMRVFRGKIIEVTKA